MAQSQYTLGLDPEHKPLVEDVQDVLSEELGVEVSKKDAVKVACERLVEGSA